MSFDLADIDEVIGAAMEAWRPPPKLTLSEWADAHFYLSAESSAEPGKWKTLPYQKGMLDAITDPTVTQVAVMKSARVGYTKCVDAAIGYFMHQDPCSMLVVQPTVDGAKTFSKEEIAPMLRDCPDLARLITEESEEGGPKDSGNTILHKRFKGGVLSLVGANSGAGFRSISRRVVLFDEVDAYPASAGSDGDPIRLGMKRNEYFWNRKTVAGSTPLIAGHSRIERMFEEGDRRRYFVPCPHCQHMAPLVFRGDGGHEMKWDDGDPESAFFVCQANGCVIEHKDKRDMVARGEWRASGPFTGKVSFHIWTAYSFSPNATWANIAREFLEAKASPEMLKTYVNTTLGETWKEQGEAPDWERLFARREHYQIGTIPDGVKVVTIGVDVQKDRVVWEAVGWGDGRESWSIEAGVLPFDTSSEVEWSRVDELLSKSWQNSTGVSYAVRYLAIDSGFNTQMVYNWVRRHGGHAIAIKGMSTARSILGSPTPVDVTIRGKRIARGAKVWPVGVDIVKSELYGLLRLALPEPGNPYPRGFCHFPEYGEDYFKQLTGEHMVSSVDRRGYTVREWQLISGRENHFLDARVYARAAASLCGLDRMVAPAIPPAQASAAAPAQSPQPVQIPINRPDSQSAPRRVSNWLQKRR